MIKTFTVAGVARFKDQLGFKVANSTERDKKLAHAGFTDIHLTLLPEPMTRETAAKYLLDTGFAKNTEQRETLLKTSPAGSTVEPVQAIAPSETVNKTKQLSQSKDAIRKRLARAAKRAAVLAIDN
jgi:hypothetical protein